MPGKMRKNASRQTNGKTRLQYPKFWLRGGQRLKLRHDLDGCSLHSWPSERREIRSTLHVHDANKQTHTQKNTSKPFLDTFKRPQMIDLCLFLLRSKPTRL